MTKIGGAYYAGFCSEVSFRLTYNNYITHYRWPNMQWNKWWNQRNTTVIYEWWFQWLGAASLILRCHIICCKCANCDCKCYHNHYTNCRTLFKWLNHCHWLLEEQTPGWDGNNQIMARQWVVMFGPSMRLQYSKDQSTITCSLVIQPVATLILLQSK